MDDPVPSHHLHANHQSSSMNEGYHSVKPSQPRQPSAFDDFEMNHAIQTQYRNNQEARNHWANQEVEMQSTHYNEPREFHSHEQNENYNRNYNDHYEQQNYHEQHTSNPHYVEHYDEHGNRYGHTNDAYVEEAHLTPHEKLEHEEFEAMRKQEKNKQIWQIVKICLYIAMGIFIFLVIRYVMRAFSESPALKAFREMFDLLGALGNFVNSGFSNCDENLTPTNTCWGPTVIFTVLAAKVAVWIIVGIRKMQGKGSNPYNLSPQTEKVAAANGMNGEGWFKKIASIFAYGSKYEKAVVEEVKKKINTESIKFENKLITSYAADIITLQKVEFELQKAREEKEKGKSEFAETIEKFEKERATLYESIIHTTKYDPMRDALGKEKFEKYTEELADPNKSEAYKTHVAK